MYIASLDGLQYEVYAVGKTEAECKKNMIKAFLHYVESYHTTVEQWVEDVREDFGEYNNDIWTFLSDYHGVHMFDITKGYALGWE